MLKVMDEIVSGFSVVKIKREALTKYGEISTPTANPTEASVFTTANFEDEEDEATTVWETDVNGITDEDSTGLSCLSLIVSFIAPTTKPTSNLLIKCDTCPENVACVPQIQCPAHVRMMDHEKPQICDLPGGSYGYCCVTGQNHTAIRPGIERTPFAAVLPMSVVEESRQKFEQLMKNVAKLPVRRGQPEFLHSITFHSNSFDDKHNFHLSNSAVQQIIAGQLISKKEDIPMDDLITNNVQVDFRKTPLAHHCSAPHKCADPNARYRTLDGTCNNPLPHRSRWGSAGQPMERLLPPAYEDGIWTPRMHSVDGSELMGAREASRRLMADVYSPHPKYNLLVMQFGQFLAHDVTQSASVRLENGELVECCTASGAHPLPPHKRHFACMPIIVEHDDDFFSTFNVSCMNFVRLSLAPNTECKVGYGKQRSKVTHFIDASTVYGSNEQSMRELREFHGGRLSMSNDFGRELLPLISDKNACESDDPGKTCYKSGDGRTNQIISLITLHVLFAREHNRIAGILARLNPQLSDEILFQEARRIVIAELQHITYNEYLPAVIGPLEMKRFRLAPQHHGYAKGYNLDVNPAITNEFSGAAFRMGHSTVDGKFHIHQGDNKVDEIINIPDVMFNPSRMRKRSFYDDMLRTMFTQPMQRADSFITHGLSRFLFRGHNPFGLDLAAFNIQRGRDQGLRSYNDYLEVMGHRKLRSFHELPENTSKRLAEVYHHPDDIDLWVGGLLENSVKDGIVGNTFAEIIADQFSRFKHGDRYFYEYSKKVNPGAFTINQLHEIRKATMARLICDNADHLTLMKVPPAAFVRADFPLNEPLHCDSVQVPVVDLTAWRV
ncbi:PREDICTED: chorion peroxidase [Rhagoletis zephyria]|uniref:chorion peroxidase n=1 Tax=Rhagoletis zephyria TaxID=28612 RepID=UPI0008117676|nr:PREDICTED: chorion peroxidase [Rhagoletis zephyria]